MLSDFEFDHAWGVHIHGSQMSSQGSVVLNHFFHPIITLFLVLKHASYNIWKALQGFAMAMRIPSEKG